MYSVLFSLWCRLPQMAANGTQWRTDDVRQGYSQPTVSKLSNRAENIAMSWYLRHPYSLDPVFKFFRVDDMTATTQSENSNEVAWPNVSMSSAIRFPQSSVPVEPRYMYQMNCWETCYTTKQYDKIKITYIERVLLYRYGFTVAASHRCH